MEDKKFILVINVGATNSPQNWKFEGNFNGLEQLAIWEIIRHLSQMQIDKLLGN